MESLPTAYDRYLLDISKRYDLNLPVVALKYRDLEIKVVIQKNPN